MQRAARNTWPGSYYHFTLLFLVSTNFPTVSSESCHQRSGHAPRECSPPRDLSSLISPSGLTRKALPTYQAEKYYPVNQGEILNDRYQTLPKIGYGVTSTVWLAKDLIASTYVVLKVYVTGQGRDHERELRIYKQINGVGTKHPGRNVICKLLDHFDIQGPHGRHVCLVHQPLGTNADVLVKMSPGHAMILDDMKPGIRQLLVALDFLHSECHIIHTDLQLRNLLLPGPDTSYLSRFEEAEATDPSPRKVLKDRTIYKSLGFLPKGELPVLADFGEA
ncbi:hypothetical protein AARAC_001471 [Aspergillus arachidicola]|uniref:non-specific serine/threonine protein kinase n=1 Tax=Aspergillus arachidicola TaxID=656916 RepID=A0A2G7FGB7_9EURO|nr:hypothetical protein AARAC_001471 [Aspergillus arachidicola]